MRLDLETAHDSPTVQGQVVKTELVNHVALFSREVPLGQQFAGKIMIATEGRQVARQALALTGSRGDHGALGGSGLHR
jgi:hypothetical protein